MAGAYNMVSALLKKFKKVKINGEKVKPVFLLGEFMEKLCILSKMYQTFVCHCMIISNFYYHFSYGKIMEHKCPMSKKLFIFDTL
jgi:hypothetical protein